jgi:hypothetical protein
MRGAIDQDTRLASIGTHFRANGSAPRGTRATRPRVVSQGEMCETIQKIEDRLIEEAREVIGQAEAWPGVPDGSLPRIFREATHKSGKII